LNIKRAVIVSLLLFCFAAGVTPAAHAVSSGQQADPIKIATIANRPIYIDRLLYSAFGTAEIPVSFEVMGMQRGYQAADAGEIGGVISGTPDLEKTYQNLIRVPDKLDDVHVRLFSQENNKNALNDTDDLIGLRVGLLTDRVYVEELIPPGAEKVLLETETRVLEALAAGEIDAAVLSVRKHEEFPIPDGVAVVRDLEVVPEYLYLHKDFSSTSRVISEELQTMDLDGRSERIRNGELINPSYARVVLHITSFAQDNLREEMFTETMRAPFLGDDSVEWLPLEMQIRRLNEAGNTDYFDQQLRVNCLSRDIKAVVVSGDDAFNYIKSRHHVLFPDTPVFIYGVSERTGETASRFDSKFTGVFEALPVIETAEQALRLFPQTRTIYVVNDFTTEGRDYRATAERQLASLDGSINVRYNRNAGRDDMLAEIKALPQNSIVLVGSYFRDASGQYFTLGEMKRFFSENCEVPIFSSHTTALVYNAIGGKCLDYAKYGELTADWLQALFGTENGEGSEPHGYARWVFEHSQLQAWGISESDLPAGAEVINKPASVWEENPLLFWGTILIPVFVILLAAAALLITARRRKLRDRFQEDAKEREVKERLESIIGVAPVAYLLCVDDIVIEINESMILETGLSMGDNISGVFFEPGEDVPLTEKARKDGFLHSALVNYRTFGGETHRCIINMVVIDYKGSEGFVIWSVDIEEEELKKDEIQATRESLQKVLDFLPVPVRIVDLESNTLSYLNYAAMELFEYPLFRQVEGVPATLRMPETQPDGTDSVRALEAIDHADSVVSLEMVCLKESGKPFDILLTVCPIDYRGRRSALSIIKDLTADKEYEQALLNTIEREKDANQLKSNFLSNMSHEIRTPMNAIIGLTELELRKEQTENTRGVYKKISTSAKNLLQIINDILDLSKIEADKLELVNEEFALEDVLNSALLVVTPRLEEKLVEMLLDVSPELPRLLIGDETRLWQILKNFLDNSAKFTENGRIVLSVTPDHEKSDENTVMVTFTITDTGIGLSQEDLQRVFLPYEQTQNTVQKRYRGTGLGMSIAKNLCELMSGTLHAESELGVGTEIRLDIPFRRAETAEAIVAATDELNGIRALAVDDDELSLQIVGTLLNTNGAFCEYAESGEQAIEMIIERNKRGEVFDVILLDYIMGGMNGLETAKRIHMSLSVAPKLLMVTAYQKMLFAGDLERNGVDDVIEKPLIPSQFIKKLRVTLGFDKSADIDEGIKAYAAFKNVRVLVCEDNLINQEVAVGVLNQFGVEAVTADNGRAGLEKLFREGPFDVVMMDLQMPVMDGYEAARAIRAEGLTLPIISLSADAMAEVMEKCKEAGMNDNITKPIEIDQFYATLRKWIPEEKHIDR
jgi:signal transduction histidine kinase/CheY-like chemotaxis protein